MTCTLRKITSEGYHIIFKSEYHVKHYNNGRHREKIKKNNLLNNQLFSSYYPLTKSIRSSILY